MIQKIVAIDTHTHINHGSKFDSSPDSKLYDATLEYLVSVNRAAKIEKMFCSTFSSVLSTEEVETENQYMEDLVKRVENLYQWVVIEPRNENTFKQAETMLYSGKCVGIKLHPPCHEYTLEEYGDKIFSFASEHDAIVQIHPEKDADYILDFANKYPRVTFIMAHMGSFGEESYADAIAGAKYGNVYADTSGIASSKNKGIEYVVKRIGSEKILFGTDTYSPGFQRGRIEYALISEQDKQNIFKENAERLFRKFL
ncbi:MAG: amidohydrolase [Ruminococcaceae bacterium]|nr:amidohydrolase [Oscillospiraceae bacterium]